MVCVKKIDKGPTFVPCREDLLQLTDGEVRMIKIKKILYSRDLVCLTFLLSKFQQSPPKDTYGEVESTESVDIPPNAAIRSLCFKTCAYHAFIYMYSLQVSFTGS